MSCELHIPCIRWWTQLGVSVHSHQPTNRPIDSRRRVQQHLYRAINVEHTHRRCDRSLTGPPTHPMYHGSHIPMPPSLRYTTTMRTSSYGNWHWPVST